MAHRMSVLGIEIATQVFYVVGMDDTEHMVLRKRIARCGLLPCIANLLPLCPGMAVCRSARNWARHFRQHGHAVKPSLRNSSNPR